MSYDRDNIFAKILRGEISCSKRYEDEYALAFDDVNPARPIHVLVIPKGEFVSMDDFSTTASAEQIAGFFKAVGEVARQCGVADTGYRLIANTGTDGHQEVLHFHVHVVGGASTGPMLKRHTP